jgi:hypothetical protein
LPFAICHRGVFERPPLRSVNRRPKTNSLLYKWKMRNSKWQMVNLLFVFSDAQPLSQPQLKPIHLTLVSSVIITAQVQQAMKDELRDLGIQAQPVLLGLARSLLG